MARWPGSCHDQTIFNNSRLKHDFENRRFGNFHLIGDSGYSLETYLLTPLQTVRSESESLYNESLIRTRNTVERKYGVWKRRFPILSVGIKVDINTAMTIIVATAILHNMAIEMNEDLHVDLDEQNNDEQVEEVVPNEIIHDAEAIRTRIQYRAMLISEHFQRL